MIEFTTMKHRFMYAIHSIDIYNKHREKTLLDVSKKKTEILIENLNF